MALGNDTTRVDKTVELVGDVWAAQDAVHDAVERKVARDRTRIRAVAKTRKSAATRGRIMAAASELMAERGTTEFQMSEVAERVGISKGALYYYFADKGELAEAVFDEVLEETIASIERIAQEAASAREAFDALCAEIARRFEVGSPLALATTSGLAHARGDVLSSAAQRFSGLVAVVAKQVERAQAEGAVREDANAHLVSTFVVGGFLMTSLAAASKGSSDNKEASVKMLVDLALHGLGTEGAERA